MSEHQAMTAGGVVMHVLITLVAATMAGRLLVSGSDLVIPAESMGPLGAVGVGVVSFLLFEWRRRRARAGLTTGQMLAQRQAELERREADVDAVHARLAELEERLDFSERMLARQDARPLTERLEEPR